MQAWLAGAAGCLGWPRTAFRALPPPPWPALSPLLLRLRPARFVCREALGEGGQEAAAYLRPVSPGSVVYGSGDAAVVVSQERAAALYSLSMQQYGALKAQLVGATAVLVGLGSGLAYAAGGRDLALPFALGGASGMLYQYMLQARG